MALNNDFPPPHIGAGLACPIHTNAQGSFQLSYGSRNLEEAITIILKTKLGERVYRPNFGSRLSELAFEPMNTETLSLIRLYVREAIEIWEPRIDLLNILTEPDPGSGQVNITILYQPKDSYDSRSMVYPFYLMTAEAMADR